MDARNARSQLMSTKTIMVTINPLIIISGSTKLVPLAPWYSHFVAHLRVTS